MQTNDKLMTIGMRFLMALAMLALVVGGFWQIFSRWVLGDPSTFTEEFMRYMLIWAGMIGSAYLFYKNQHLALDLVKSRVKGTKSAILEGFIEIMALFFVCYIFIYGGGVLVSKAINASSVLRIPFKYLYLVLPVSGVFIVVSRALHYAQVIANRKGGK
jgi:TRAP-type C4-dicarboxylate transport system permease small subunit